MPRFRPIHVTKAVLRAMVYGLAAVLVLVALGMAAVETGWVKNQIRRLIVRQANGFLTGTVEIGRLEGSLFRGLTLGDVRVVQNGQTIISVDEVSLRYSIRELTEPGLIIRQIHLTKPRVVIARVADGRWNLAALLRRDERESQRSGPGRPLHILAIDVEGGDVDFRDPFTIDTVHIPSRFDDLNASLSFDYQPVTWSVRIASVRWHGDAENIGMNQLTGGLADGPSGWEFNNLAVQTPRSSFILNGRVNRGEGPATLALKVNAERFAFQEWAGVIGALRNIAVDSSFKLALTGPLSKLAADIDLTSASGNVQASLSLDTTVPGWHASGRAAIARLKLSDWLNRPDRPSDITGTVVLDVDLDLGHHFPRGSYTFNGPHVAYIGYEMSNLSAHGVLTRTDALIADATGVAYGAALHITDGSIGIDEPYAYRFQGSASGMDLTALPPQVPLTHVESDLTLEAFDVNGQFATPAFIRGTTQLGTSVYLGATVAPGAVGSIDTSRAPTRYSGEGDISGLNIGRFGASLDVDWMRDPRWAGTIAGHFHVDGAGSGATMTLDGGGRLARADMFDGHLSDADVSIHIADGSLSGTYDGQLSTVDTARAFADDAFAGNITGSARASFDVRDLLLRATTIADYHVDGSLDAEKSTVRGLDIYRGRIVGTLAGTTLDVRSLHTEGPVDMDGSGVLEFDGARASDFHYLIGSADLALAQDASGYSLGGTITTAGTLSGPMTALHLTGNASLDNMDVDTASIASTSAAYDMTFPWDTPFHGSGRITGTATELYAFDREIPSIGGTIDYADGALDTTLTIQAGLEPGAALQTVALSGSGRLHPDARAIDVSKLSVTLDQSSVWQTSPTAQPSLIAWSDAGVDISSLDLTDAAGSQHASIAGSWRTDGTGVMRLAARQISLDAFTSSGGRPARYGGTLNADATIRGTREHSVAAADVAITDGRVRKLAYSRLGGRLTYESSRVGVDLRLDQSPGTWLTVSGDVPFGLQAGADNAPVNLTILSSPVGLGLIEGVTDVVTNVSGQVTVNVKVTGTAKEPHFDGTMALADAAFLVAASGARYKNGRATFNLATDRITVSGFHLEDRNGRPLDVSGSLGTRALGVGDIEIQAKASRFEVLRNASGTVDVKANLTLRGELAAPRISGDITILSGELKVDELFERALFQPYATEEAAAPGSPVPAAEAPEPVDAIAALNPWDRLGLDIALHSPGTLRMIGENVQVATGTPLGLGSFNLHATGDLYLYKDPGQPMDLTGSFDSISGSYAFQGRRFDVDPSSSVNFRGDFSPDVYVTVSRLIDGIETHVTITGNLRQPELQLASSPPLEQSDILSLIVFNTSTSELSATQQQELAARAGTLAYGFVATPLVAALQRSIGLETLEITPPTGDYGTTVTIGNELAPGLVAQFTREFGQEAYDEATIEYYISRILRLRATFSDAQSLVARSPFRRQERAGIDLLFFFSF